MLLFAPEGPRIPQPQRGKEGMASRASRSDAPIFPVAIDGTVGFPALRLAERWRKPGAQITFGRPFRYLPELKRAGGDQLRTMADEAMYVLSAMLPEERRGVYIDLSQATHDTLQWV